MEPMESGKLYELLANLTDQQLTELMDECERRKMDGYSQSCLYEALRSMPL